MTQGTQCWFYRVRIFVVLTLAAVSGTTLVNFFPSLGRQTALGARSLHRGLSSAMNRPAEAATSSKLVANYGKLPLGFEVNEGQTDARVKFLARGKGYSLFLTGDEAVLTLRSTSRGAAHGLKAPASRPASVGAGGAGRGPNAVGPYGPAAADAAAPSTVLRMRLVGGNLHAAVTGADQLPGKSNYFIGSDAKKWRTNVPNYARVKYSQVYPGVDLAYYGNQGGHLEYDFVVAPGADPGAIRLAINAEKQAGSRQQAAGGKQKAVSSGQETEGTARISIAANGDLVVKPEGGQAVRFHKPVIYQPDQAWSSAAGPSLVTGHSSLINGHYVLRADNQVGFELGPYDKAKPLVIDPVLSYSTYLGGNSADSANGIAIDSVGNAYLAGSTESSNFPTVSPLQGTLAGTENVFVAKLNPAGSALLYSTYLGGSTGFALAAAIAVDSSGNAYVTGYTGAADFPTLNPVQASFAGGLEDAFVAELNAAGSALVYSTYLGGGGPDYGYGIAVDSSGNAYVTGETISSDFPTTTGAFQQYTTDNCPHFPGNYIPFTSTYRIESGNGYTVLVGGISGSSFFTGLQKMPLPNVPGRQYFCSEPVELAPNVYQTALLPTAAERQGYFGGIPFQLIDPTTNLPVPGNTFLPSGSVWAWVLSASGQQLTSYNAGDGFVAKLSPGGSSLVYSTFLGGSSLDAARGIAIDSSGNAYVTGVTLSTNFPTLEALQTTLSGGEDAFVMELDPTGSFQIYSTYLGGSAGAVGLGIAVDSSGSAYVTGDTTSSDFPTLNAPQPGNAGGIDAFVTKFNPTGSALVYSTFLGGSGTDIGEQIAVDSGGNAYVVGYTASTNFPTVNALQASYGGGADDAFVARLNPPGSALVYSTYLGGSDTDIGRGIAVDSSNNAYVTGSTISSNFPVTPGALQQANANNCATFPFGFVPFTSESGIIGNPTTGFLYFGTMTPTAYATMASLPPPSFTNQAFCDAVQMVPPTPPSTSAPTYGTLVPTAAQQAGDFSAFGLAITNPSTGQPYPSNMIPPPTGAPGYFAWPIIQGSSAGTGYPGGDAFVAKIAGVASAAPSPTSLTFPTQMLNSTSTAQSVTLTNSGDGPLSISSITVSGDFALDSTASTCPSTGGPLASLATCMIGVTFTPMVSGTRTGMLTINDSASGSPQTVTLSGTGATPVALLSATSLTFANQAVGTTSSAQPITLSNTGTGVLNIFAISSTPSFSETDNCGTSVSDGASCTINVTFAPAANGPATGTLTITDNSTGAATATQTVTLSGTGTQPGASLSAPSLSFGNQPLSTASSAMMETLTNSGTANLTVTTVWIGGTNPTDFSKSADTCTGATVAPSSTCTVSVTFTPAAAASRSAVLNFTDNAAGSPQTAPLTGTGTGVTVSLSPTSLTFAAQTSGTTSSAQTVTVTNTGNQNLTFTGISVAAPFAIAGTGTTCSTATPVAGGGACTVAVTFSPTAGGSVSGTLGFTDNASSSAQSVAISGAGQDFLFAPPAGSSTSASTAPGTPATFTLSVGGQGGLTGTVNFSVTGCPSATTCTVSPNPVTAGSTPTNVTVTATTTAPSAAAPRSRPLPPVPPLSPGLKNLLLALALATLAWAVMRWRQPGGRRGRAALLPIAAAGLLLLALTACGGGGSSGGTTTASPGTPPGTYTLTVTGSTGSGATALSHSVMLTLTVS